jgi:hypothetical protein
MSVTFYIVCTCLNWLCDVSGLRDEAINLIIWCFIVPFVYLLLLDKIIGKPIFSPRLPCLPGCST